MPTPLNPLTGKRPKKPLAPDEWVKCPMCQTEHDGGPQGIRICCSNRKCSGAYTALGAKGLPKPKGFHQKKSGVKEPTTPPGYSRHAHSNQRGGRKHWVNV